MLREAKKRDNNRYIAESADKPKAMWRLINREIGKPTGKEQELQLKIGNKILSKPTEVTDKLNSHFMNTVKDLITQKNNVSIYDLKIEHCPNSIFICPVTEEEVIGLAKSLKGKPTSGNDDIPENLVKQCIHLIKGPLTHIYNLSLTSGVFPVL